MHPSEIYSLVDEDTKLVLDQAVDKAVDGMVFVEIGSYLGSTACRIAARIKEQGKTIKLFAIDNWECANISDKAHKDSGISMDFYDAFMDNVCFCRLSDYITPIISDSIEASKEFGDGVIDFLFIDGHHQLPYISDEIDAWLPKMKDNSMIVGHDFSSSPDVQLNTIRHFGTMFTTTPNNASYIVELGNGL